MISGLGSTKGSWTDAIQRLSSHYRTLAIDNRDAGENGRETEPYSISDMADDTAAFLHAMRIEHASVMGSSMGGFIALHLALTYPLLVDKLVLVGTSARLRGEVAAPRETDWIEDTVERARKRLPLTCAPAFFDTRPERLEELAAETQINGMTYQGYLRQTVAIQETHDVVARLDEITQPALVVHGDADAMIPLDLGEELAAELPNSRLVVLPGVGHVPHRETPDVFCALVEDFLAEE
jgi:pimeloyl-ACP methyl ester carboxylesterase